MQEIPPFVSVQGLCGCDSGCDRGCDNASAIGTNTTIPSAAVGSCGRCSCEQGGQLGMFPIPSCFLAEATTCPCPGTRQSLGHQHRLRAACGLSPNPGCEPESPEPGTLPTLARGSSYWQGTGLANRGHNSLHCHSWIHQSSFVLSILLADAVVRGNTNTVTLTVTTAPWG